MDVFCSSRFHARMIDRQVAALEKRNAVHNRKPTKELDLLYQWEAVEEVCVGHELKGKFSKSKAFPPRARCCWTQSTA
jgi:hypothetical protein